MKKEIKVIIRYNDADTNPKDIEDSISHLLVSMQGITGIELIQPLN